MKKIMKDQKGALIIEASILLPLLLFVFLTFYSIIDICIIQAKVQLALNNAAREISEYSYIYSFSGAKDKAEGLYEDAQDTKDEVKENVVDNIATVMSSITDAKEKGEEAYNEVTASSTDDLFAKLNAVKTAGDGIKDDVSTATSAASSLKDYLVSNLATAEGREQFFINIVKVLGSDTLEVAKNYLGGMLAEAICKPYLEKVGLENLNVDYKHSQLFPGTSSDIIFVAEYNLRVAPYIPIEIYYTFSQQAVTRGWLDGDGGMIDKTKLNIKEAKLKAKNIWTEKNNITGRAKTIREAKIKALSGEGYYQLKNPNLHVCNPDTNTYGYIGSSNPLYGLESLDEIDEEAVVDNYTDMISKLDTSIATVMKYKRPSANSTQVNICETQPYLKETRGNIPIKKTIFLTVPEDPGLMEKMQEIWNAIPEEDKHGVTLVLEKGYGSNYKN